jgi:hypothetical protein
MEWGRKEKWSPRVLLIRSGNFLQQPPRAYPAIPCPERATIGQVSFGNDREHSPNRFFGGNEPVDLPCDVNILHIATPNQRRAPKRNRGTYVATSPGCMARIVVSLSERMSSAAM